MNVKEHKRYNDIAPKKYIPFDSFKMDEEGRTVSFYAAVWNTIDSDEDILIKGCCAKSLSEHGVDSTSPQKIMYLYCHKTDKILGRIKKIVEDDYGLYVEAYVSKTQLGNETLAQYLDGSLNQHSIGFKYIWDKVEWDETKKAFIVKEIQLFEVSVVSIAAHPDTRYLGVKSEQLVEAGEELTKEIESFLKSLDPVIAYRARQLFSNVKSLSQIEPDIKSTLKSEPIKDEPKVIDWSKVAENL